MENTGPITKSTAFVREPPAAVRAFARRTRDLYVALLAEGFAEDEARNLVGLPILMHLNEWKPETGE